MVEAIVGRKGGGKTAAIMKMINELSQNEDNNIVCLEVGRRFDGHVPYTVRLVDVEEFPLQGYGQVLAFIAGVIAKDYDISHIFLDSIYKIAKVEGSEGLTDFVKALDELAHNFEVQVYLTISDDPEALPSDLTPYLNIHH